MLGLCCCVWAFCSCSEQVLLSSCSAQAFFEVAPYVAKHELQAHRLQ